ncbi:GT2 family glycosyltransferase [Epilithonimonas hungarica]|uniref:glycosyltransferase family 2 protein n=1 Tax=Epilithonimonas hungarica TaxID=454006 RepID=UPI0027849599|nr:glycosyltransferase family 2 protein [Epilithonimonas hungarica]MDP9954609.1 GT2 family glycosyltransferase [Epilithonimonas hungarica]
MASIGLVTVLYNSDDVLAAFFKSLSEQSFTDYHLYMIDNSVSESSTQLIHELTNKYSIKNYDHIKNENNVGVAKGNNQGIEKALKDSSEYILLLNNDIEFDQQNLLGGLYAHANRNDEKIIIPKIFYSGTNKIWMAGGTMLENRGYGIHIGDGKEDSGQYNKQTYFTYAPTCFMLIHKSVFEKTGLMDEKYFVYYDDTDFVYRALKKGFRILYLPEFIIQHRVAYSTGGSESLFSIYYCNRNRMYFILKNLNNKNKISALLLIFFSSFVKMFRYNNDKRRNLLKGLKDGIKVNAGVN